MKRLIIFLCFLATVATGQDYAAIAKQAAYQTDVHLGIIEAPADYIITPAQWNIQGSNYKPGDRLILQGDRVEIQFTGLKGTAEAPIIITALSKVVIKGVNAGGRVVQFINCQHVRFTGDPGNTGAMNIEITGGTQAVDFRDLTTNCEADHLYIHDVGYLGIGMKTDVTCDPKTWRGAFTLYNPIIHHCSFERIKTGEAIYIGESDYHKPWTVKNCTAKPYVHDVVGVQVYDNTFVDIGRDAIQIGSAVGGGFVRNNRIYNYGMTNEWGQSSGIQANPGSVLVIEDNVVEKGTNFGIILQGRIAGTVVRRNLIKNTVGGVFTVARENDAGSFLIENNTFVDILPNAGNFIDYYSNTTLKNNVISMKSGAPVFKRYGGTLTDTNNDKRPGLASELDANGVPTAASTIPPGVGWKDYVKPPPVVIKEPGTVELITTDGIDAWYLVTPSGKRKKIE